MDTTYSYAPEHRPSICQCGNHLLLSAGETCDICMGLAPGEDEWEAAGNPFDDFYFEALEASFEELDQAA